MSSPWKIIWSWMAYRQSSNVITWLQFGGQIQWMGKVSSPVLGHLAAVMFKGNPMSNPQDEWGISRPLTTPLEIWGPKACSSYNLRPKMHTSAIYMLKALRIWKVPLYSQEHPHASLMWTCDIILTRKGRSSSCSMLQNVTISANEGTWQCANSANMATG